MHLHDIVVMGSSSSLSPLSGCFTASLKHLRGDHAYCFHMPVLTAPAISTAAEFQDRITLLKPEPGNSRIAAKDAF